MSKKEVKMLGIFAIALVCAMLPIGQSQTTSFYSVDYQVVDKITEQSVDYTAKFFIADADGVFDFTWSTPANVSLGQSCILDIIPEHGYPEWFFFTASDNATIYNFVSHVSLKEIENAGRYRYMVGDLSTAEIVGNLAVNHNPENRVISLGNLTVYQRAEVSGALFNWTVPSPTPFEAQRPSDSTPKAPSSSMDPALAVGVAMVWLIGTLLFIAILSEKRRKEQAAPC